MKAYSHTIKAFVVMIAAIATAGCGRDDVATEASIQRIEGRLDALLGDLNSGRKDIIELQNKVQKASESDLEPLAQEVDKLLTSLPVFAGIELSEELATLDWLVTFRQLVSSKSNEIKLLTAEELLKEVPWSLEQNAPNFAELHAAKCIQLADEKSQADAVDADNLEIIVGLLERLKPRDEPSVKVDQLMQVLKEKSKAIADDQFKKDVDSQIDAIKRQLENVTKLQDAGLRRSALLQLSQRVDLIRVGFAMEDIQAADATFVSLRSDIEKQLAESLEKLSKEQTQRVENARMKYQAWALGEIQALNQLFKSDGWFEKNYQKKHDAAVTHLLPINQANLEPPVAKFYNEAFEKIWQQLADGTGMQLSLAAKSAEIPKRTLESFMEHSK